MKNMLVTGGAGFIGANFIRYLLGEHDFAGRIINLDKLTYAGNLENLNGIEITGELSSFRFSGDHQYWGLHLPGYTTSYETLYTAANLSNISRD